MKNRNRDSLLNAGRAIVTRAASVKKNSNLLIICGVHNKNLAEQLMLQAYAAGAHPFLWVFDERPFLRHSRFLSSNSMGSLPSHTRSLLEKSDVVIWLSQFSGFPSRDEPIVSFWNSVYHVIKNKPRLLVNLPSAKNIERSGIPYGDFLRAFVNAIRADYAKIRITGSKVASKLEGKEVIRVCDPNGTDLTLSIKDRPVGIEVGTLEECYTTGKECEVEVPSGEVYVAPLETSATGTLIVDELRDFGIRKLQLGFEKGKMVKFKAQEGTHAFNEFISKAEGDKDRIAELGIGINHDMKPVGWRIYDEKALGTVHIAIGENRHMGGINKATIHLDFILYNPTIEASNTTIMKNGKPTLE